MYTLFNNGNDIRQTNTVNMVFENVKREIVNVQIKQYKDYRAINPGYLKSDHVLHRLLAMVDIPFTGDLPDYYLRVSSIVNRIASQMGFCTGASHGRVTSDSSFYGKGIYETIIAVADDDLSPAKIWFNWRRMSAVRVLSHPLSGIGIIELDGTQRFSNLAKGANAVIEINIPLLACQYHLWRMATESSAPDGYVQPMAHFLTQVVIPNMIGSHLDVCILNTVHTLLGATSYTRVEHDMPFYLADFSPRVEKALKDIADKFTNQTHLWKDILQNIPVISQDNLLQTIRLPDIPYTNQAIWALMLSRMHCIALLLRFNYLGKNRKNDADVNRIRRSLIEADSGKYLVNQIPADVAEWIKAYLDDYIRPYI